MPRKQPKSFKVGRITVRRLDGSNRRGRWRAEWYPAGAGGRLRTRSLGWSSRKDAERAAAALLAGGLLDEAPRSQLGGEIRTVRQVLDAYAGQVAKRADLSAKSVITYQDALDRLSDHVGDMPISLIGRSVGTTYRDRYLTTNGGRGTYTVHNDLSVYRAAVRYLQQCGLSLATPPRVQIQIKPTYSHHTPTSADVAATLRHFRTPWHRAAICLLWGTGARVSDIHALRWTDIGEDTLTIPEGTKTGRRVIPLSPRAREGLALLREHYPEHDIWPPQKRLYLSAPLNRATREAGVERFSPHGLRRLAVDEMRRAGVPLEVAAAITGHSPTTMIKHYRTVSELEVVAAMRRAGLGEAPRGEVVTLTGSPYRKTNDQG